MKIYLRNQQIYYILCCGDRCEQNMMKRVLGTCSGVLPFDVCMDQVWSKSSKITWSIHDSQSCDSTNGLVTDVLMQRVWRLIFVFIVYVESLPSKSLDTGISSWMCSQIWIQLCAHWLDKQWSSEWVRCRVWNFQILKKFFENGDHSTEWKIRDVEF